MTEFEGEVKVETPETPPVVCEFKGYLKEDGKILITSDSEECRKAIVAAGKEIGVEVAVEEPVVECEPCKEAAKRFLAKMQARKAAKAAKDTEHTSSVETT
ncbi:unnamed protein product [marine sediment metagenome]|uniref:Uncharacterized protein n=1 Tax=marine sediment metagenome TaxID=412755 RepID=X1K5U6_9ZZZZ